MKSQVAVVRCDSYEPEKVRAALREAIELLGGFDDLFAGLQPIRRLGKEVEIILKPNLLAKAAPERAVTTHPQVFRAVGELLKEEGYGNLVYGDSPGSPVPGMEKTAEGCGIRQIADELGIRPGDFEHGTQIEYPQGHAAKHFTLCDEVVRVTGADGGEPAGIIINLCKMKTHQLERITGAVKNTFGCVCGINKAASHAKFESPEHFARMLADLNCLVRPALHVMDGIIAMEGNGPGSGDPVAMNAILVSTDPVALDTVFCKLIYLDPQLVATNIACAEAGVGTWDDEQIDILLGGVPMQEEGAVITEDELEIKYAKKDFNVQRSKDFRGSLRLMRPFQGLFEKKPVVLASRCVGCGICEQTCPVEGKAIHVQPSGSAAAKEGSAGSPASGGSASGDRTEPSGTAQKGVAVYDYSRCIKCYCCQEMCPARAITVKKSLLAKIIDRKWKM